MKKKVIAVLAAGAVCLSASGGIVADAAIAKGDVDQNGSVDLSDASEVLSYYARTAASLSPVFDADPEKNAQLFAAADVDENGTIDLQDASLILTYYAYTAASLEPDWDRLISGGGSEEVPALGTPDGTLGEGGDTLTIMSWSDDELQHTYDIAAQYAGISRDMIEYKNVGASGYFASEQYAQVFASGEDVDIYLCDVDWVKEYENNDSYSAPLSGVGITEAMYADAFDYTVAIGKDNDGVLKGASWESAAGGYVYRTDLADQYLGITNPTDMQAAISDWDGFWNTAERVYSASSGVTAMADSLNGVVRTYLNGSRNTSWTNDNNKLSSSNIKSELEWMVPELKHAYDYGYISTASQWTDSWLPQGMSAGVQANKTFGFFFSTWNLAEGSQLAQAQNDPAAEGSTYGMYNIVPGPSGWYWGGAWMCVYPGTDNASEAGKYIYSMTVDPDAMRDFAKVNDTYDMVNNKKVMEELASDAAFNNQYLGGQNPYAALIESAEKVNAEIISEYDADVMVDIGIALQYYCEGVISTESECINNVLAYLEEDGYTVE